MRDEPKSTLRDDLEDINDRGLVWLKDGAIHHDSRIREYPRIELERLITCVEDNIVEEDGVEDIDWHGVIGGYLEEA